MSQLLSTRVDAQTCRVIAIDREIGSMTEFKQIVGRGTRIHERLRSFFHSDRLPESDEPFRRPRPQPERAPCRLNRSLPSSRTTTLPSAMYANPGSVVTWLGDQGCKVSSCTRILYVRPAATGNNTSDSYSRVPR